MQTLSPQLAALLRSIALATALGAGLGFVFENIGSSPRILILTLLAALVGQALAPLWRWPDGRPGARLTLALAGLALALGGGIVGARWANIDLLFALGVCGASAGWRALPGGARGPAQILSAPFVLPGLVSPLAGIAVALTLVALLDRRAEPWRSARAEAQGGGALDALLALCGGYGVSAALFAARAHLDPTPLGFGFALACALAGAGLGARRAPGEARAVLAALSLAWLVSAVGLLPLLSFRWIQPLAGAADPRARIAALVALLALPGGFGAGLARPSATLVPLALALGVWLGADSGAGARGAMLLGAAALALGALFAGRRWPWRLAGAFTLAGLAGLALRFAPWDEPALLRSVAASFRAPGAPDELGRALGKLSPAAGGWGPDGATLVYTRGSAVDRVFVEGTALDPDSRAADTERMLGALGAALAGRTGAAIVLGEQQGLATRGLLEQGFDQVSVVVSDPGGLRARAALDPGLSAILLHPAARLRHIPPELHLRASAPVDALIEIARNAYPDATGGLPSPAQLRLRRDRLAPGGVYLLVVPAHRLDAGAVRGLAAAFAATFPRSFAALPPNGADELILCGAAQAGELSWAAFVQASTLGLESLAGVGVRSPLDLADRLIADSEGMTSIAGEARWAGPLGLPPNLHARPAMLAPLFADVLADPERLFGAGLDAEVLAQLRRRRDVNRDMLTLLDQAARGDVRRVFEQSQALTQDPAGQRALNPIVRPYLERAEALVAQGLDAGPSSNAWTLCLRETEAARLLDPLSADVHAMSGKCSLAANDARTAETDFLEALRLDRGHEEALLGLAQVRVSRGDVAMAEQALREAVKYNPQSWRPRYHLGALLLDLNRLDEAEEMLAQSRTLAGDRSALPYGALAHVALRRGDPNAALVYAERAVALDPVAKHLHLRGLAYFELDQLDQAERDFKDAIYTDPKWWPARGDLGRIMAIRGDYAAAAQAFQEVLNADPGNPGARENLRRVEEKLAASREPTPE